MILESFEIGSRNELPEQVDFYRTEANRHLVVETRSALGQFMTPAPVASFMASLFQQPTDKTVRLLDPGAGVGSLTAAFIEKICQTEDHPDKLSVTVYEIDALLLKYLNSTLKACRQKCKTAGIEFDCEIVQKDFIGVGAEMLNNDLFSETTPKLNFSHAIINPPYKKINSGSKHRLLLRSAGIETSNLYTAFLFLTIKMLQNDGELVAIVPRSFCNGPYFKPFRKFLLQHMGLQRIHVFKSRDQAFKDDEVLQENMIFHAIKGRKAHQVVISASAGPEFDDMTIFEVPYDQVVELSDPDLIIHIVTSQLDQYVIDRIKVFRHTLNDLNLEVSTGPVVDFRLSEHLLEKPNGHSVPLIYPAHFEKHSIKWPKINGRKPNAIADTKEVEPWLMPNGHYTLVRRFSSKEERRRLVAAIHDPQLVPSERIGFENHLNIFHSNHRSLSPELARGLAVYLNSTLVDTYFRQFNGHTQVNAADLRMLNYPDLQFLKDLGAYVHEDEFPPQEKIDFELERKIQKMAKISSPNPIKIKKRIDETIKILKELGLPKAQQNERSALTLLALANVKPLDAWKNAQAPLIGLTPIMDFSRDHYGKAYAPNTRETFCRFTMHQFVEAAIAIQNPDQPARPINSPNWCYQIEPDTLALLRTHGSAQWKKTLAAYQKNRETLKQKYAREREMILVPVRIGEDQEIQLTPGKHSELIKQIIESFCPRFSPGGQIIYVGDTGSKWGHFDKARLEKLGVEVDVHGKMPDAVIYYPKNNWMFLIEVWVAEAPSHLIHFDGSRFLGPYER